MPDYNESQISGHAWQRCHQIVIENRRNTAPSVRFDEERIVVLDGGREISTPAGSVVAAFDPDRPIPLRDPMTGELTGAMATHRDAYTLLNSAYLDAALARDVAMAEAATQGD